MRTNITPYRAEHHWWEGGVTYGVTRCSTYGLSRVMGSHIAHMGSEQGYGVTPCPAQG
ncbi:hypothetical protein Nmel_017993 [Mimus melanotis]